MELIGRRAWSRFITLVKPFFKSEVRWHALSLLALLVILLLSVSGLNVLNSYVGRDFMTALADRQPHLFSRLALLYTGVFGLLTVVAVFARFVEERLGVLWREWLTKHLIDKYLANRAYYRMQTRGDIDNPDQRITEDVRSFTSTTLSFLLIFFNSTLALISFAGILWSITPWLVLAAVGYAAGGSLIAVLLGRKLVSLNIQEQHKEANLRYEFIRVREHAESVALLGGEGQEKKRLRDRLTIALGNVKTIIAVNRNLGFFTTGFNYMTQVIPLLIVAPLYIGGQIEFGTVTQAAAAFGYVLGAFSVIVSQFGPISSYAAVVTRLGAVWEAMSVQPEEPDHAIETVEDDTRIAYEHLTLRTPRDGRVLIKNLSLEIPEGKRLLVVGPNGVGRSSLIRATAGLWRRGDGTIYRPPLKDVMFLPQRPYLMPGSLRDQVIYSASNREAPDEEILEVLRLARFEPVLERIGGLDVERDWNKDLSLSEQQQLALAGLLLAEPRFAFLDEATSALDPSRAQAIYRALARTPITYVSVANDLNLIEFHDELLELSLNGSWRVAPHRHVAVASA